MAVKTIQINSVAYITGTLEYFTALARCSNASAELAPRVRQALSEAREGYQSGHVAKTLKVSKKAVEGALDVLFEGGHVAFKRGEFNKTRYVLTLEGHCAL